jgi:hypothetical protein
VINYAANTVWSEPHCRKLPPLKMVYEGKEPVQEKAVKGRETIVNDLSLKRVGELIKSRCEELLRRKELEQNKSTLIKLYGKHLIEKRSQDL